MRINTNIMALNAQNKLTQNQLGVEKSIQRLSSGLRINRAADDAAGLAISEKMRAQIRGLNQAESNAQDGISLLQTAEGALQQTTDILQRMRELVIKAQNTGVLTNEDKTSISNELSTLRDEIDRIATSTTFNGKKLLNGDMGTKLDKANSSVLGTIGAAFVVRVNVEEAEANTNYITKWSGSMDTLSLMTVAGGEVVDSITMTEVWNQKTKIIEFKKAGISIELAKETEYGLFSIAMGNKTIKTGTHDGKANFKIGANTFKDDLLEVGIGSMTSEGLNWDQKTGGKFNIDISTAEEADKTLKAIDYAIDKVSSQRSKIGVVQNRMEYAINNLSTIAENLSAAESRIRDVDMADEMVKYTKNSILNQSAMAMLAQANKQPQEILSLLQ